VTLPARSSRVIDSTTTLYSQYERRWIAHGTRDEESANRVTRTSQSSANALLMLVWGSTDGGITITIGHEVHVWWYQ
jgi:hypothetical protein